MQNNAISPVPGAPGPDTSEAGEQFSADPEQTPAQPVETPAAPEPAPQDEGKGFARVWERLVRLGLGESALRVATSVVLISFFLIVVWVMGSFYLRAQTSPGQKPVSAEVLPTPTLEVVIPDFTAPQEVSFTSGVSRLASLHTTLPAKPRSEVETYTVQNGDTLFGIAEKYNLKPETILWSNRYTLGDDPETIRPGIELFILPVNGVYHKWSAGEGLNGVAKFYGVKPEDIVNYPGNNLTMESVGDFAHPNIAPGTMLIIKDGHGVLSDWKSPRITRTNAASAAGLGPGGCSNLDASGLVGSGSFIWPTTMRNLSGYDYTPDTGHYGIDIAGTTGNPVYAVDAGVVVFAGWSVYGYGNMIAIDHGNGWQSVYAHLSSFLVGCGQSVAQGATIGAVGSTGNSTGAHLHFELRNDTYGRVNPWDFLR
jgi:murein DD-endopeptidase MepM/ murein hydrolase activator NlpD